MGPSRCLCFSPGCVLATIDVAVAVIDFENNRWVFIVP